MSVETVQVPGEYARLAQEFMLGRFLKVEPEPFGRTLYCFQNGSVLEHKGAFGGLVVRDTFNGYRAVKLRRQWVQLALRHRLGAFQGCDVAEGRKTFLFEYGAIETSGGAVQSVIARGARVTGDQLMVEPALPGTALQLS